MPRHAHTFRPLLRPPRADSVYARANRLLGDGRGLARYLTCPGCGRVGWWTRFGRLSWHTPGTSVEIRRRAAKVLRDERAGARREFAGAV